MTNEQTVLKRHPIRGALWGIPLGMGVAVFLVIYKVIGFDSITAVTIKLVLVVIAAMALGALWGMFGPAKKPKGAPLAAATDAPPPPPDAPPPAPEEPPVGAEDEPAPAADSADDPEGPPTA
jgi:hypothetical protein